MESLADADDSVFCESTIPTRLQGVLIAGSWIHEEEPIPLGSPGFLPKLVPGTSLSKHKKSGFPVLAVSCRLIYLRTVALMGRPSYGLPP